MIAKWRALLALPVALIYVMAGVWTIWSSIAGALFNVTTEHSVGLGAVSIGISEALVEYGLLAFAALVVNRLLASWARAVGGRIKTLHRAHTWAIPIGFAALVAVVAVAVLTDAPLLLVLMGPLTGIVWGVQLVLTAALLCLYALRTLRAV